MPNKRRIKTSSLISADVTTTISISLVLFLVGMTLFIVVMGREISSFIKENLSITIELTDSESNPSSIAGFQKQLNESPYIKAITFISKDEIKKELIEELGGDPEDILGYTPVSNYFEINLKSEYANPDSIKMVAETFKSKKIIKNFIYSEDSMQIINSNLSKIGFGLSVLALILMIISFTLIRNTIRLNIYSKRFLINTMQLVGATDKFIRKPFVVKGIISGIIGAMIANIGITTLIYGISKEFPEITQIVNVEALIILYVVVCLMGVLFTYFANRFAVNRYLKMETNNLYYI